MKRFHVHVAVDDLDQNIRFYSSLFGSEPSVRKDDYAKWMLDNPRVNFAISKRGETTGVNHLGIQVENDGELLEMRNRLSQADQPVVDQPDAACCYSASNKHWVQDPQGIAWETFHTLSDIPMFGRDTRTDVRSIPIKAAACCVPNGA
ncbi:MAG TPA: ArsI/CadI family heavy metal resistance metalloenzyme [Burkholderiales bacterium]|nr:ArsI/CadI family heavy metal resistance metalloenzyme [Burkholderiales bacterium]